MPSRKKAQGKARKAAKAEKRRAEEQQSTAASNDQQALSAQMQQLQLQDLLSQHHGETNDDDDCMHGHTLLPDEDVAHQFMISFMSHFCDALNSDGKPGPKNIEAAMNATDEMLGYHTLQNEEKVDWCLSYLYGMGTEFILGDDARQASIIAEIACLFELNKCSTFGTKEPELFFANSFADIHTLVSFFRKKIPCSCLDEKYEDVKKVSKLNRCRNPKCFRLEKRRKFLYCTGCRSTNYCSRECQKEDWSRHKQTCGGLLNNLAKEGIFPLEKKEFDDGEGAGEDS